MEMRAPSLCSSQLVCDLLPGWHACHVSQSAAQCARALCFDLIERCCQWSIASRLEADRPGPSLRQALCCRSRVAIDWRAASTCRLRSWTMLIIRWRVLDDSSNKPSNCSTVAFLQTVTGPRAPGSGCTVTAARANFELQGRLKANFPSPSQVFKVETSKLKFQT